MSSSFNGFSEEDIHILKTQQNLTLSGREPPLTPNAKKEPSLPSNVKKIDQIGSKRRRPVPQYKLPNLSDDQADFGELNVSFDKCKLSLKTPTDDGDTSTEQNNALNKPEDHTVVENPSDDSSKALEEDDSINIKPDVVSSADGNYNEGTEKAHAAKLGELQLKQKLMEEQNRKRKEMLAKALADRTKQTEEEVLKLEKIKRELSVLDGQFSQDVAVLRKKIDHACFTYADAEKQYLRVEREFLQAKLNLQKEKEKKELLSEHLCALITHNETRKAQKLVTLMEQLAYSGEHDSSTENGNTGVQKPDETTDPVVVDGVDERTGKMVEINDNFS